MTCFTATTPRAQGTMELLSGCNMDQSLEQNVTGVLNNIREIAGKVGAELNEDKKGYDNIVS